MSLRAIPLTGYNGGGLLGNVELKLKSIPLLLLPTAFMLMLVAVSKGKGSVIDSTMRQQGLIHLYHALRGQSRWPGPFP